MKVEPLEPLWVDGEFPSVFEPPGIGNAVVVMFAWNSTQFFRQTRMQSLKGKTTMVDVLSGDGDECGPIVRILRIFALGAHIGT